MAMTAAALLLATMAAQQRVLLAQRGMLPSPLPPQEQSKPPALEPSTECHCTHHLNQRAW